MNLTAALRWVCDNVAGFGGDPARVTIMGQSGGGAKVSALLAAPAAKGLFHRAVIQSGSVLRLASREAAATSADKLLRQLGMDAKRVNEIQHLSWQQLLQAQTDAVNDGADFSPTMDGRFLPHETWGSAAPPESAGVPLMVSTLLEDSGFASRLFDLDEPGLMKELERRFPGRETELATRYNKSAPQATPFKRLARVLSDSGIRRAMTKQVELKLAHGAAPV